MTDTVKDGATTSGFLGLGGAGGKSLFSWFKPKSKALAAEVGNTLHVYASDIEWQTILTEPDKADKPVISNGDILTDKSKGGDPLERTISAAVKSISKSRRKDISSVTLVLDDPQAILIDDPSKQFSHDRQSEVRWLGGSLLDAKDVGFGVVPIVPKGKTVKHENALYGFLDLKNLANQLNQVEDLILRVRRVVPGPSILAEWMVDEIDAGEAKCAVTIMGSATVVTFVGNLGGVVVTRTIPIGVMTLVKAVAEANSVSVSNALNNLTSRDRLSTIPRWEGDDSAQSKRMGELARKLGPLLTELADGISASIDYFSSHRMGGEITEIHGFGPFERITGLGQWLEKECGLPLSKYERTSVDISREMLPAKLMNILKGSSGSSIQIGSAALRYSETEGFQARTDTKGLKKTGGDSMKSDKGNTQGRGRGKGRSGGRRGAAKPKTLFFGIDVSGLMGSGDGDSETRGETSKSPIYALGVIAMAVGFLGVAYTYGYEKKVKVYESKARQYAAVVEQNRTTSSLWARKNSEAGGESAAAVARDEDKVLWTEKMLGLARYMNERMWITDVYLTSDKRTISGGDVVHKVLSIEGAVLPSTDGHILEISNYIRRLLNDKYNLFMSDFSDVTFEGATLNQGQHDEIVTFQIDAVYDEAKRVGKQKSQSGDDDGEQKQGGLLEMNEAIAEKDKRDQQFLPAGAVK
jgi:hypothetical protein